MASYIKLVNIKKRMVTSVRGSCSSANSTIYVLSDAIQKLLKCGLFEFLMYQALQIYAVDQNTVKYRLAKQMLGEFLLKTQVLKPTLFKTMENNML